MNRRFFAASLLGLFLVTLTLRGAAQEASASAGSASAGSAPAPTRLAPNIVLLFADDQRTDTIGAHGNFGISTPNIDSIVARGTSFRRAYCMGSPHGAVCAPSRAMLHSGRPYHSIDHSALTDVPLLGEKLQEAGYRTFGTGKWHNGRASFLRSFGSGRAVMFGGMSDHNRVPIHDVLEDGTVTEKAWGARHSSDLFAAAAIEFVEGAPADDPFFLSVAFTAPHDPRDPPLDWRERERPPLPANFAPQHAFDNGFLTVRDEKLAAWPRDPQTVRKQLAEYYGLIEHMDAAIGRILATLAARGDDRPTVIIYAADHGLALGSHGLLGKQSVYEHSLRTPMVIAGPGVPAGLELTSLTYLLDLYPTLLSFAGAPEDTECMGKNLAPLWRGEKAEVRRSLYLSMGKSQRAVTDGRWKLCVYPRIGHRQLFDLASDPYERVDLAPRPAFAHHIERLATEMDVWRERTGDPDPLVVAEPAPFAVDLTGRERAPDRWQPRWIREAYFPTPSEDDESR